MWINDSSNGLVGGKPEESIRRDDDEKRADGMKSLDCCHLEGIPACSCKILKEAGEDSHVYKHISLNEFPIVAWHDNMNEIATNFISRCMASGNPDAFYRKGMAEYFAWDNLEIALECLNKSANSGHVGAYYIISIILLSNGDDFKEEGIEILSTLKRSGEYREKIIIYRENLIELLRSIWMKNPSILNRPPTYCTKNHRSARRNARTMLGNNEKDCEYCDACVCDKEMTCIFKLLHSL